MKTKFLKERFSENDNSAQEFKTSLSAYLEEALLTSNWEAMSEYALYLQGAKQALEEVVNILNQ